MKKRGFISQYFLELNPLYSKLEEIINASIDSPICSYQGFCISYFNFNRKTSTWSSVTEVIGDIPVDYQLKCNRISYKRALQTLNNITKCEGEFKKCGTFVAVDDCIGVSGLFRGNVAGHPLLDEAIAVFVIAVKDNLKKELSINDEIFWKNVSCSALGYREKYDLENEFIQIIADKLSA